jgi:hypothetical protein
MAAIPYFFLLPFALNGGQGRNRTADAGLFRAALYQLSYLAEYPTLSRKRQYRKTIERCQLEVRRAQILVEPVS